MSKVILEGYLLIPQQDLVAVLEELANHIQLTRAEPGCLRFEVRRNPEFELRLDVYEEFRDSASFQSHQQRTRESHWGRVSAGAERHYTVSGLSD